MFKICYDGRKSRAGEACGLALFLSLLLVPGTFAQQPQPGDIVVRQTAAQSLTLIKPSDPRFDDMIDINYPGLSHESAYQSMRPFLVIVRNDTGLPAVAYAITWTTEYTTGPGRQYQAVVVNRPLMNRGAMQYIPSGAVRLLSPVLNLTPKDYQSYQSFSKMFPASIFRGSQGLVSVDIKVDGVVYNDNTFIGEDKTRILQRYVMARFAIRDESRAALRLINSTGPQFQIPAELQQMLNNEFQWGAKADQDTPLALYVRARGQASCL